MTERVQSFKVGRADAGRRLDTFLAARAPDLTRSQAERLAKSGRVLVNARRARPARRLAAGEEITVARPEPLPSEPAPESIPLTILFEDDHILVLTKSPGIVVHPGAGRSEGTLVNALLAHAGHLPTIGGSHRPGIVHRLDRDTSGLMAVAKTELAYRDLSRQVRRREVERSYLALVWGALREDRLLIDVPIGRHLRERKRMAAVSAPSEGRRVRSALTDVTTLERFGPMTLVEAHLETGRTHQIRVHLAHQGHPVVGDPVYGRRRARQEKATLDTETLAKVRLLPGQALHAHVLRLRHPVRSQQMSFSAPPPREMALLLSHLRSRSLPDAGHA